MSWDTYSSLKTATEFWGLKLAAALCASTVLFKLLLLFLHQFPAPHVVGWISKKAKKYVFVFVFVLFCFFPPNFWLQQQLKAGRRRSLKLTSHTAESLRNSRPWNVSREGQQSCKGSGAQVLQGVAEGTGILQRGGGSGETLLLSTTAWKEVGVRWESASSPRYQQ